MAVSIDNIVESLTHDTQLRVQNDVGQELSGVLRDHGDDKTKYETQIRATGTIANPEVFVNEVKDALIRVLERYLHITPVEGGIRSLSGAMLEGILGQYMGYNETGLKRSVERIDNYDDWAHSIIDNSRSATVSELVKYGQHGIQEQMMDNSLRNPFLIHIATHYFPAGFAWGPQISTTIDYNSVAQIVAAAVSGTINPRMARDRSKLLTYTPPVPAYPYP